MKKRYFLMIFTSIFLFLITAKVYADSNILFIEKVEKDGVVIEPNNTTEIAVSYDLHGSTSYELHLRALNISDEEDYYVMINNEIYETVTSDELNQNGYTISNNYDFSNYGTLRIEFKGKDTNNNLSIEDYEIIVLNFASQPKTSNVLEEILLKLDNIPNTSYENGQYNIELPTRNLDELFAANTFTRDSIDEFCSITGVYCPPTIDDDWINSKNDYYKDMLLSGIISNYFKPFGLKDFYINTYDYQNNYSYIDHNQFELSIDYVEDGTIKSYKRVYNFTTLDNLDNNTIKDVDEIIETTKPAYILRGKEYLNSLYHYGSWSDILYDNDIVLYMYQDVKELILKNANYDFEIFSNGGGDTLDGGGAGGLIIVKKDGIVYGARAT